MFVRKIIKGWQCDRCGQLSKKKKRPVRCSNRRCQQPGDVPFKRKSVMASA